MDQPDRTLPSGLPAPPRTERTARRPRRWPWVLAGLILVVGVAAFFLHGRKPKEPAVRGRSGAASTPVMIGTATARKGDIGVYVNALGFVTPVNTVAVRSRVDGQIIKVEYTEGQTVHHGDSLVEIDSRPFQAALTQAEGQLARDMALLENARLDLERYKEAVARNAVPKQQLDTQTATVHQEEGAVKLDQGQLDNAQVQLAYCHITAPITGRVGLRLVDAGNIVHASDTNPLVTITQLEPITVVFSVAEDYLPQIQRQLKQGKQMTVDALDRSQQEKLASGTLQTLDNQIDPTTGTVKLKAVFTNEDNVLFPNQFVNARLLVETHRDIILLPNQVIQRNAQGPFVYFLNSNQTVSVHPVTIVTTDGNESEVEGLEEGATVAADNFNRLIEGAKVVVRPAPGEGKGGQARPSTTRGQGMSERRGMTNDH